MSLTHFNAEGRPQMVSVDEKTDTLRIAIARGSITMAPETLKTIEAGKHKKGDVLSVAQVAGVMAAKNTAQVIPMCHPLMLTGVDLGFELDFEANTVHIETRVKTYGKTGVEMEALTAAAVAGLTIYDMCKAMDKNMVIGQIRLMEKEGGRSGHYKREED